jgi:hypothetical protein
MTSNVSKKQRLLVWKEYFEMLSQGEVLKREGEVSNPYTEEDLKLQLFVGVIITQIRSDIADIENGREEYCRWDNPKDLSALDGNIDVRKE